jgi:hypothetical protein
MQKSYNAGFRRSGMTRTQLNVRVSDALEKAIDEKRIELRVRLGTIPTRSDVLRLALEAYLGIQMGPEDADGRTTTGPQSRKATAAGKAGNGKAG